ncbi:MAG: hypothetical protein P1U34_00335 [Coxiellaceae bacterium]|nr:hypothetical protein [Coxiellaceae bacterium]
MVCASKPAAFNNNITAIFQKNTKNLSGYNSDGVFAIAIIAVLATAMLAFASYKGYRCYQRNTYKPAVAEPRFFVSHNVFRYGAVDDLTESLVQEGRIEMQPTKSAV